MMIRTPSVNYCIRRWLTAAKAWKSFRFFTNLLDKTSRSGYNIGITTTFSKDKTMDNDELSTELFFLWQQAVNVLKLAQDGPEETRQDMNEIVCMLCMTVQSLLLDRVQDEQNVAKDLTETYMLQIDGIDQRSYQSTEIDDGAIREGAYNAIFPFLRDREVSEIVFSDDRDFINFTIKDPNIHNYVIQVNGYTRAQYKTSATDKNIVEKAAREQVKEHLQGSKVFKTVFMPNTLINFLTKEPKISFTFNKIGPTPVDLKGHKND
jgi:hypothetical protein